MRLVRRFSIFVLAVMAVALWTSVSSAQFTLRSPQVVFSSGSLQGYLNGVGQTINVNTDQLNAQIWTSNISGNAEFTLMIELAGNAASNNIGIYNANAVGVPPLYLVFPGAAGAGWFATAHFSGSNLTVTLFDNNSVFQGQNTYTGVDPNHFGFYLQGPGGLFYSQDVRNSGAVPQMLTYAGTGTEFGDWWECFEDLPYSASGADFEDAVLLLQSVVPTPARTHTLGGIKARYR